MMVIIRREDDAVITIYVLWLHLIFVTIIPVALLIWLNRIIYRKLSEAIIFVMSMMMLTMLLELTMMMLTMMLEVPLMLRRIKHNAH